MLVANTQNWLVYVKKKFTNNTIVLLDKDKKMKLSKIFWKFEKYFYVKTIVTKIPENLITNLNVFFWCSFVETKNKHRFLVSWCYCNGNNFYCLFIVSHVLLKRNFDFNYTFIIWERSTRMIYIKVMSMKMLRELSH